MICKHPCSKSQPLHLQQNTYQTYICMYEHGIQNGYIDEMLVDMIPPMLPMKIGKMLDVYQYQYIPPRLLNLRSSW